MSLDTLTTELNGRTLRYDGVSIVSPEAVPDLFMKGVNPCLLRVNVLDPDIETFNRLVPLDPVNVVGPEPITFNRGWLLPRLTAKLDVQAHVMTLLQAKLLTGCYLKHEQVDAAMKRTEAELALFTKHGMDDLLRCLIWVIEKFKEHKVVYGVGRGSSCASYVLFLIGLHLVDPIKHEIPIEEFFKPAEQP
jgi:hypothetical protein